MSRSAYRALNFLALGAALALPLQAQTWDDARLQMFFEWGRYDSLLQELSPMIHSPQPVVPADRRDSSRFAQAQLYLGVACFSKNQSWESDQAFRQALRWDPEVKLDPFFVSKPMSARFQELAEQARVGPAPQNAAEGSPTPIPAQPAMVTAAPAGGSERNPRQTGKIASGGISPAWYWGAGALTAIALGGGYYFLSQGDPEPARIVTHIDASSNP